MTGDLSDMTYEAAGVSIKAQNEVNKKVAERLRELGMKADGLFGGAVDISQVKGKDNVTLDIFGESVSFFMSTAEKSGYRAAETVLSKVIGAPIGVLDYVASEKMDDSVPDFVTGVAKASLGTCLVLGGESAQMGDTYKPNCIDAFVHAITIREDGIGVNITDLIKDMEQPLVVATTDGTGTKTKIVRTPEDIIYHGFNDVSAQGVKPIAFALYISGNVSEEELSAIDEKAEIISKQLGVEKLKSLIVQKPDTYLPGEVDIAGTVIGVADGKNLVTGANVSEGDVIIGIQVDGAMTNGYSLLRKAGKRLVDNGTIESWDAALEALGGYSFKHEISKPHRPMSDILFGYEGIEGVLSKFNIKGMAHITGGGQPDNIIRMVPDDLKAVVDKNVHPIPSVMKLLMDNGVPEDDMHNTFNMGVGYTFTVAKEDAESVATYINEKFKDRIPGVERKAAAIGYIAKRAESEPKFEFSKAA